jgi:hypothetical protein
MTHRFVQRIVCAAVLMLSSAATTGQQPDLQVLTTLTADTAYVNQQVLLQRDVNVSNMAFGIAGTDTPAIGIADVLPLSEVKQSDDTHQQIRTHWAIFARESGSVSIAPQTFQATLPATGGSNPVVKASSDTLSLKILPAPPSPPGAVWLPAQALSIEQQWASDNQLIIGEPKELVVTVTTRGQRAAAIPPLTPPDAPGLRWYSSVPTLTDKRSAAGVTGTRIERFTVVAQAGDIAQIPAFSLAWFDTTERAWQQTQSNLLSHGLGSGAISTANDKPSSTRSRLALPALLLLAAFVLGVVIFVRFRRPTESVAWRRVKQSLRRGEPKEIRESVLAWARLRWPSTQPTRVEQLAALLEQQDQRQAILELNSAAFGKPGKDKSVVSNELLANALETLRNRGLDNVGDQQSLAPLYPVQAGR